jgi:predicted nucleotidyltransferase
MNTNNELITIIIDAAAALDINIMLIGAFSRDYWRERFQITAPVRTTEDIDFACQIMTWNDYQRLFDSLKNQFNLHEDKKKLHTLWLRGELAVDLLPFGGVADENGNISWPPEFLINLCVLGYDAAKDDAEIIDIEGRRLKVIKPYWLALLKLQAYAGDTSRDKDLVDFYFLVDHYLECIDEDSRLYNANAIDADIFDMDDFDTRVAASILIKRDCLHSNVDVAVKIMNNLTEFNSKDELTMALSVAVKISADMAKRILSNMINVTES